MDKITGILEAFSETGTEGMIWMVYNNCPAFYSEANNYDRLVDISEGDRLTVYDIDGSIFWSGEIKFSKNSTRFSHWFQEGFTEEEWAEMFQLQPKCVLEKSNGSI